MENIIVDDFTPFHGLTFTSSDDKLNGALDKDYLALIVTDGERVSIWDLRKKSIALKDASKKLSNNNLNYFSELFDFENGKSHYKIKYDIEIPEPEIYNP